MFYVDQSIFYDYKNEGVSSSLNDDPDFIGLLDKYDIYEH